jgi:fluoride ion exporter CrcB/FEX
MESTEHESNEHWAEEFSDAWETNISQPGRKVLRDFFYPPRQQNQTEETNPGQAGGNDARNALSSTSQEVLRNNANAVPETPPPPPTRQNSLPQTPSSMDEDPALLEQERQDREYVERFWTAYDDILILSLFTQIGILCRLGAASWFRIFDAVFRNDRALFTNLPLNCLSCFVMGLLCSGESLMQIISTRFTPPRLQHDLHQQAHQAYQDSEDSPEDFGISPHHSTSSGLRWRGNRKPRRRKRRRNARKTNWKPKDDNLQNELREVQLLALERRIRASPCLVLFPVKKEDVDVVENYFNDGYRRGDRDREEQEEKEEEENEVEEALSFGGNSAFSFDDHELALDEEDELNDLVLEEEVGPSQPQAAPAQAGETRVAVEDSRNSPDSTPSPVAAASPTKQSNALDVPPKIFVLPSKAVAAADQTVESPAENNHTRSQPTGRAYAHGDPHIRARHYAQVEGGNVIDYGSAEHPDLDQIITNVATDVSQRISRISRVSLADGWDVGTSPEEKSEDLMLGLRDGLCGALSSFSSWISSMVSLLRAGQLGEAFVGLLLGIQLPLIAYRFGQHVAVYIFVWRCRRETRRDERRGYGIRLSMNEDMSDEGGSIHSLQSRDVLSPNNPRSTRTKGRRTVQEEESETPSVRAIITALFIMALVAQVTSLNFFYEPEDRLVALSLLFSPLGVLTRWRLSKLNSWRPNFPIGTFACNISACALAGTLGTLLAGNPGSRERIALVAIIAGFGGTLSSVARFIVEILAGMDPILFRMDGVYYAISSVFWGLLVSFFFSASVDWADSVE